MNGYVYLIGAGPGDEGLITKKAVNYLKKADIVLYDHLLNPSLLRYTKPTCELIYCGKMPTNHIMRQGMINTCLVQATKEGKIVVRLKGGDPSIFGRVGEEARFSYSKHFIRNRPRDYLQQCRWFVRRYPSHPSRLQ